jgi:hypothetical protein
MVKEKIMPVFLGFTIQDWFMLAASITLILCLAQIRSLKNTIAREIQRSLLPQLILNMDNKEMFFNIRNEGFSLIRNIEIEDSKVIVEDYGYKLGFILRFENIEFLRPREETKLKFKVFNENQNFLPDITETIFPHLINPSFNITITCSDIEGRKFRFLFSKKGEKLSSRIIELF